MEKMKKKVQKHLKDDIKGFKKEAHEDKVLLGMMKSHKNSKRKEREGGRKGDEKLHKMAEKRHEKKESKAHEKKESKGEKKFGKVMREFKDKSLHSGSKKGPKVTNPKQAVAIAYSEARRTHKKKK